jgi:uncharacterized phage protein (TIGR02218 family)
MTRTVLPALQAHLDEAATTTCRLLKFTLTDGRMFGITTLDRDIEYDDGLSSSDGAVTYVASNGFDPSAIAADLGYSVSNAEAYALLSDEVPGITEEMVRAGELDDATWILYLVNFESLSDGHVIIDAGDVGEIRLEFGMVWMPELLSYSMRLKQPIGSVWSRTCRAIFGSPAASQTGCGVDITPLWVSGTVTAVGLETDRTFSGDNLPVLSDPIVARVQWLTGDNAGREYAVETLDSDEVSLIETTAYAIQVGDTYRARPDCAKQYERDCIGLWANGPNFKGEPLIPVGDGQQGMTPGAQLPGGGGQTFTTEDDA